MNDKKFFQTFLLINSKEFLITVTSEEKKKIYEKKYVLDQKPNRINFDQLDIFLNENIFKIEKILKDFVNNVYIILESKDFFNVEISVKKNDYKDTVDLKSLDYLLNDAKNYCKKTIDDRKIVHIIIQNYQIDKKYYSFLPKNIDGKIFSLDLKFICISNNIINKLEKILKKYQISLKKVVNANYVKEFFGNSEQDLCFLSKKIIEGCNPNEVMFVNKIKKNQGFFEKFFNFFN